VGRKWRERHEGLVNAGINLSKLDCRWAETYTPEVAGRWVKVRNVAKMQRRMRSKQKNHVAFGECARQASEKQVLT
jgi:hypothetical protein